MVPFSCLVGLVGLGVCPIRDESLLAGGPRGRERQRDVGPLFPLFGPCNSEATNHEVPWYCLLLGLLLLFDFADFMSLLNHGTFPSLSSYLIDFQKVYLFGRLLQPLFYTFFAEAIRASSEVPFALQQEQYRHSFVA